MERNQTKPSENENETESQKEMAVRKILFIKILFENDPQHRREKINLENFDVFSMHQ